MKIGVIGSEGVVGGAVSFGFRKLGHTVVGHDLRLGTTIDIIKDTQYVFICVPTPSLPDGSCNTAIVESVVKELIELPYYGTIVIKSTVPPGTTKRLGKLYGRHLVFCPEFLRERSAISDFVENHKLLVVGCYKFEAACEVASLHGKFPKRTLYMSPTEAECVKLYHNTINALRITFANEFYDICQKIGADYTVIKDAALISGDLPDKYLEVNEAWRGYSGPCLPKDTKALIQFAKSIGVETPLISEIDKSNSRYVPSVPPGMREI